MEYFQDQPNVFYDEETTRTSEQTTPLTVEEKQKKLKRLSSSAKEENPATHFSLEKMSIEIESIGTDKAAAAAASASSVATSTAHVTAFRAGCR